MSTLHSYSMHTFWHIARFELRYHINQPVFYLFYGLIVAQGFLYGQQAVNEEAAGLLYSNSPGLFFSVFSTVGVLLTAIAALLAGQSLLRDRTYRVGDYLYALPLNERLYFAGKLTGVLGTCLLLSTGAVVGVLLLPVWVTTPAGPFSGAALLLSFVLLLLPNLLIVVCLAYALTAFFQRMAGAYVALLVLVVGQVLFRLGEHTVLDNDLLLLLDPFGHVLIREALSQQTPAEQWAGTLPVPDLLLINRLLWLGLSGGLIVRAADRLTFQYWASRETNRAAHSSVAGTKQTGTAATSGQYTLPTLHRQFTNRAWWKLICQLARRDFLYVVRQPAFMVVALLLAFAILGYATGLGNLNETGQRLLPFTSRMTYVRLPLLLFIGLFLTVFSGELLHRERSSGMWPLVDATPQPGWLLLLAKYGAMLGVAALLTGTLFLTGLSIQLLNGQTPVDWSLYATDLLLDGWLRYAQLIALAFLIQTVIPNRMPGQLASATVMLLLLAVDQTGLNGVWFSLYSSLPNSWEYSEVTGYGNLDSIRWVYAAMWSMVALLLLLLASGLGQRGVVVSVQTIGQRWRASLKPGYVAWLTAVTVGVLVTQLYLRFPVNQPQQRAVVPAPVPIGYRQATQRVLVANRPVTIRYHYVHDQNLGQLQAIVARTLTLGNAWLGTFPEAELTITEVPFYQPTRSASPMSIDLSERDGWLTDIRSPDDAGQVDITIARTLLRHWVGQRITGDTFITQSLPDYLALRVIQRQRGDGWLTTELTRLQRTCRKLESRQTVSGADLLTVRGPLSLTCVGEVWGHEQLCQQIGQFIRAHEKAQPASFDQDLAKALPDSLTYLTTYLSEQPTFDFRIGQLGTYPDRISVHVRAHKFSHERAGSSSEQLLNDYVPVVLLNAHGRVLYRQLILANTDGRTDKVDWLPAHPDAVTIVIDPLGAWPERNKRDNQKLLARVY